MLLSKKQLASGQRLYQKQSETSKDLTQTLTGGNARPVRVCRVAAKSLPRIRAGRQNQTGGGACYTSIKPHPMKTLVTASLVLALTLSMRTTTFNIDFCTARNATDWRVIVDGVMGGMSSGTINYTENTLQFTGELSLRNNGGFSQIRKYTNGTDMSPYQMVEVRIKGDGRRYGLQLAHHSYWAMPYRQQYIQTEKGQWQTLQLPMANFKAYQVGRPLNQQLSAETLTNIKSISIILNDKIEGPFALEIDYIKFY